MTAVKVDQCKRMLGRRHQTMNVYLSLTYHQTCAGCLLVHEGRPLRWSVNNPVPRYVYRTTRIQETSKYVLLRVFYFYHISYSLNLPVFDRAAFSYSVVQPPLDINFPWSLGYIRKLAFRSLGKSFHLQFVWSQQMVPKNIKLAQTLFSQGTNSHLGWVEPLRFISVPREIHV